MDMSGVRIVSETSHVTIKDSSKESSRKIMPFLDRGKKISSINQSCSFVEKSWAEFCRPSSGIHQTLRSNRLIVQCSENCCCQQFINEISSAEVAVNSFPLRGFSTFIFAGSQARRRFLKVFFFQPFLLLPDHSSTDYCYHTLFYVLLQMACFKCFRGWHHTKTTLYI